MLFAPLSKTSHSAAWRRFWLTPNHSTLEMLLATDFSTPSPAWANTPALDFGSLSILACADARAEYRDPQSLRLYGYATLGSSAAPALKSHGHDRADSTGCRLALQAWEKLLAEGPKPTPYEASIPLEILLSSDIWEHPEFMEPVERHDPDPCPGQLIIIAALELAALADPSLATGSGGVDQFALAANGRNRYISKAGWLLHPRASACYDLFSDSLAGLPLWMQLCSREGRLGKLFTDHFIKDAAYNLDSPFAKDARLAKELLVFAVHSRTLFSFHPDGHRQPGELLLSTHAQNGNNIAQSCFGLPDLLWTACQKLPEFDDNPPLNFTKIIVPGGSAPLAVRTELFHAFERLVEAGSDPELPGPDGRSPIALMHASRGYGPWISQHEARSLDKLVSKTAKNTGAEPRI